MSHSSMLATQIRSGFGVTGSQAVEKIPLKVLITYFHKTFFFKALK